MNAMPAKHPLDFKDGTWLCRVCGIDMDRNLWESVGSRLRCPNCGALYDPETDRFRRADSLGDWDDPETRLKSGLLITDPLLDAPQTAFGRRVATWLRSIRRNTPEAKN